MSGWDDTYKYAWGLFGKAKGYDDIQLKGRILKQAWNAAFGLADDYVGRSELLNDIEQYARRCGIDLSKISAY